MIRKTRLSAAFALGAGLMAAGLALAQTQSGSATPLDAISQASPSPAQSTPPLAQFETPMFKPWETDTSQATYSVKPPDGSSGIYLPAVVLGYAKSVAGCFVIGCDDGPQVDGSSGASSSGSAEPPANKGLFDRR